MDFKTAKKIAEIDEQIKKNDKNERIIEKIDKVTESRSQDVLSDAINERIDKIEKDTLNGQYVSKDDKNFVQEHNGNRANLMYEQNRNNFAERENIEEERRLNNERKQLIEGMKQRCLDELETRFRAGFHDVESIQRTQQTIQQLDELKKQLEIKISKIESEPPTHSREEIENNQEEINKLRKQKEEENKEFDEIIKIIEGKMSNLNIPTIGKTTKFPNNGNEIPNESLEEIIGEEKHL